MSVFMNIRSLRSVPFATRCALKCAKRRSAKLTVRLPRMRRPTSVQTRASASSDSAKTTLKQETKSVKQYAGLHDFCMTIPYGAVVSLVGLGGLMTGGGNVATVMALAGIASCVSSALSLKAWRSGANNTRYTLASSGLALGVAAVTWRSMQSGAGGVMVKVVLALSAAMVAFLIYNIAAGGNPPKRAH